MKYITKKTTKEEIKLLQDFYFAGKKVAEQGLKRNCQNDLFESVRNQYADELNWFKGGVINNSVCLLEEKAYTAYYEGWDLVNINKSNEEFAKQFHEFIFKSIKSELEVAGC